MDLSKAYDCVNDELVIAKLTAYWLSGRSLRLIQNFVKKQPAGENKFFIKRMARNNFWCAPRINIKAYFVQHFHKWLLFVNEADVYNFANGTSLHKCGRDLDLVSHKLEMSIL